MIALLLATLLQVGENRLWFVDVELAGACEELRLDCGADGDTRLLGPFPSGGERRLSVPVPIRSPLGAAGLAALPLPRVEPWPPGPGRRARVIGWSSNPPSVRLERRLAPLLARPRPPSASASPRAARSEILLCLVAGGFLLRLRRRPWLCLGLGCVAAVGVFALARARGASSETVRLVEWEPEGELGLSVRAAHGRLPLPRERLEVHPESTSLSLEVALDGSGQALAPGALLFALETMPAPWIRPEENRGEPLEEAWTRTAGGEWLARGAWPSGEPLPAARGGVRSPPGWLASALPPGRPVLLARTASGAWLRCLGFESPVPPEDEALGD